MPVGYIERTDIRFAFFDVDDDDAASVSRPHRQIAAATARRGVVAGQSAADVEIEIRGEVARLRSGGHVHHPEIWLRIGANRLADGADERELFSVRTERECAGAHVERGEFRRLTAGDGDGENVSAGQFVIRFVGVIGNEIEARTVFGPERAAVVVTSAGQLFRRDFFIAGFGSGDDPDVLRMFEVEIAGAVRAIDRAIDHAHVAFAFGGSRARCGARTAVWLSGVCLRAAFASSSGVALL